MKYKPVIIPRKKPKDSLNQSWFKMLTTANIYSVENEQQWQDKGLRTVSGYVVMNPKGYILPSTFSVRRATAKSRCLEPALQKFKGLIHKLFADWEAKGFKVVKIKWVVNS